MKRLFFLLVLVPFFSFASPACLCIEGGGSKTNLQILDENGNILPLIYKGVRSEMAISDGSNFNVIGKEGVRSVLRSLLENTEIEDEGHVCLSDCKLIAGMSGALEHKQAITLLFEEFGLKKENIQIFADIELALKLVRGNGAILIAGTGSIAFGKKDEKTYRVGGLGKVLGDEGSGYQIGLQAIKAALAQEYGWGTPTSLTSALKEFFHLADIKSLIRPVNSGELSPREIGSITPLVFEKALEKDLVAEAILQDAARDLHFLLEELLKQTNLSNAEIHLWGGIFKNSQANLFIEKMTAGLSLKERGITIVNNANKNSAVLFAQRH